MNAAVRPRPSHFAGDCEHRIDVRRKYDGSLHLGRIVVDESDLCVTVADNAPFVSVSARPSRARADKNVAVGT